MSFYVTLGKVEEFRSGAIRSFSLGGQETAIARVGERFYAFGNICTHRHEYMSDGFIQGAKVICTFHDAEFEMATGAAVGGPAFDPLPVFPVRVEGDEVQIGWAEALSPADVIADYRDGQDDFARQFII
jgi:nitrite reductase/ring-hydroxylating ferredoxin subunit